MIKWDGLKKDGIRINDYYNDHSFEEMKIRLQTKAFEDGYLRFPDEEELEDLLLMKQI